MHISVMAAEVVEYLSIRPEGVYLDATAGLGGHTAEIARRLTTGMVIANDRDPESLAMARQHTSQWAEKIRYHRGTFSDSAAGFGRMRGFGSVNGLVADLGVSRYQLTTPERGFSFNGRGAAGYAHGFDHGHDGGGSGQSNCRKGTRRSDLSVSAKKGGRGR